MIKIPKTMGTTGKKKMTSEHRRKSTIALYYKARQKKLDGIEKELIRLGYCV